MKKIFFFALASLALASCSQDEEFVAEKTNGSNRVGKSVLSFSNYTAGGTRGTTKDVNRGYVVDNGFKVSAWFDGAEYFSDNAVNNQGTVDGTAAADANIWDTEGNTYYWPTVSATKAIDFRAFNNIDPTTPWNWAETTGENAHKTIQYDIPTTAADQKDLVIAYASATSKPADGVQPLNFTHALSKINFSFKGANEKLKYTVNRVEVIAAGKNVVSETATAPVMTFADQTATAAQKDAASWNVTANATGALVKADKSDPTNGGGVAQNQSVLYTYYDDATGVSNNPKAASDKDVIAMTDQDLMLFPQNGRVVVRVYYKVESINDDGSVNKVIGNCGYSVTTTGENGGDLASQIRGCKTAIIDLSTLSWSAGSAYRYTMTLPTDNFIGDLSEDGVADGLENDGTNDTDLDGDDDTDPSEFNTLTPIRFSVTVSDWETAENNSNITIK
jgi:hypothetical protein